MAYFNTKETRYLPLPVPIDPPYTPPIEPTPPTPTGGSDEPPTRPTHTGNNTITFYINNSDNNVISKTLVSLGSASSTAWKNDTSILNPIIEVNTNIDLTQCNYCYVDTLQRYYYITDVVLLTGNIYELHCRVDVLQTYANKIKACTGVIKRNENNGNLFVADNNFIVESRTDTKTIAFSNTPFTKAPTFLLTVSGGD